MKVNINKPHWDRPFEDEVEEVIIKKVDDGVHVQFKGGKTFAHGHIVVDYPLSITVTAGI